MTYFFLNRPAAVIAAALTAALVAPADVAPAGPASTAEARGAELAQGVERITEPHLVSLHCMVRMGETIGFERDAAAEAAGAACEAEAGARLVEIAGERASRALTAIKAAPAVSASISPASGRAIRMSSGATNEDCCDGVSDNLESVL